MFHIKLFNSWKILQHLHNALKKNDKLKLLQLPFPDVLSIKISDNLIMTVHCKSNKTDICISKLEIFHSHWIGNGYLPVLSAEILILDFAKLINSGKYFVKIISFLNELLYWQIREVEETYLGKVFKTNEAEQVSFANDEKQHLLSRKKGDFIIRSRRNRLKNLLPYNIRVVVILKDKHSSTYISIKIKTEFQHKHDVLHYGTNMHWWLHWKGSQEYIRESNQS